MSTLDPFFNPRRIAVVGASPGKLGFANLALKNLALNKTVPVTVISRSHAEVDGFPAVGSIKEMPNPPDLCIVGVRANLVPEVLRDCMAVGVPAAVVVASGFAEQGTPEGRDLQAQLDEISASGAIRIIGPNTMGVARFGTGPISIASANIPHDTLPGSIGIVSQSGGVATTLLRRGVDMGLGFAFLATLGNEMDVSLADVIRYYAERAEVRVILCYVEAIRNVDAFRAAIVECNAAGKPVIVLKGGRTEAGGRATASHTGAIASDNAIWQGAMSQLGVVDVKGVDHALAAALIFSKYGIATGTALGGFATGGGGVVLLTDMLSEAGVHLPPFVPETRAVIREALPDVEPNNPFEMGGQVFAGNGENLSVAIRALANDPLIDALVFSVLPMVEMRAQVLCTAIVEATRDIVKPVIVLSYDGRHPDSASSRILRVAGFPIVDPPEAGAMALKSWLGHRTVAPEKIELNSERNESEAFLALQRARSAGRAAVLEDEGKALLTAYGLPSPWEVLASDADTAIAEWRKKRGAVALKILSEGMLHRGVGKGVFLNLQSEQQIRDAYDCALANSTDLPDARLLLQSMVEPGAEFILGAVRDPSLGLALVIGRGGSDVERTRDATFCLAPVTPECLRTRLAAWGYFADRGCGPGNPTFEALFDAAGALCRFLDDAGEHVQEIDLNPIIVSGPRATMVDALIILRASTV